MPNYCFNKLKITTGSNDLLNEIKTFVKGDFNEPFDFDKIIPHPAHIVSESESGIDWRIENWGTKWNAITDRGWDNETIEFITAWEPPIPVLLQLSKLYPSVAIEMEFGEEGGTHGKYKFLQGRIKSSQYEIGDYYFKP